MVVVAEERRAFVAGACTNCGSLTHTVKDCLERPRKKTARYGGEVVGRDEYVQQEALDYDGKRDRWKGYDSRDYTRVIERYDKAELERKKKRLQELEQAYQQQQQNQQQQQESNEGKLAEQASADEHAEPERKDGEASAEAGAATGGEVEKAAAPSDVKESDLDKLKRIKQEKRLHKLRKRVAAAAAKASSSSDPSSSAAALPVPAAPSSSSSDSDSDDGGSDDELVGSSEYRDYGEVITKMDGKSRTTVRNLRIREDTAKYLRNLNPNSAHYDPKVHSTSAHHAARHAHCTPGLRRTLSLTIVPRPCVVCAALFRRVRCARTRTRTSGPTRCCMPATTSCAAAVT